MAHGGGSLSAEIHFLFKAAACRDSVDLSSCWENANLCCCFRIKSPVIPVMTRGAEVKDSSALGPSLWAAEWLLAPPPKTLNGIFHAGDA